MRKNVKIDRHGKPLAVPDDRAAKLLRIQCWSAVDRLEKDCQRISQIVAEWRADDAWKSVAANWAEFCTAYVKLPEDVVFHLCEAARHLDEADHEGNDREL